jgi:archaellum biogenesis ATPase FlaH
VINLNNELTPNQELVLQTIKQKAIGRSKAITVSELSSITNITERKVRETVSELRKLKYPISSTVHKPYGYFIPANVEEAEETVNQLRHRIKEIKEAIKGYEEGLNILFNV